MQGHSSGGTRVAAPELTGTVAGRFLIVKLLGAGGMGQVYRAEDTKLKRVVAIKRMAPRLQQDDRDRRRFLREAQQASALNHPNIAAIYDVIEEQGEIFLIMEYVEGTPLRAMIHNGFSTGQFFDLAIQSLEGLNAAHEKGILHGDIKPENIMLTPEGRVKVLDFGVARRFSTLTVETLTGTISGTPAYMAPEVLTQKPYDGRADLFSMGLVCYEMLGGQQPFETDSIAGTMASVLHRDPPLLEELNPKVPPSVSAVVRTMLEKNPARRYASARDVLIDLRRAQQGENPVFALGAAEDGVGEPKHQTKFKFSKKIQIALAAAMILIAALVGWSVLRHNSSSSQTGTSAGPTVGEKAATLVVLPFDAVSEDPKLTAFGNGLVDTLTAKLMQLSADHPLQVVSASEMRQKNVGTLARARQEFGANTVVRVTYSLTDGRTGKVLKAETIDAPVTDPFSIENRVAKGVASALGFELRPDEARELAFHGTSNPDAYNYYTQAHGYLEDRSKTENVNSAIILLTQALKTDPNYGRAEADLGSAYWMKYESSKDKTSISKSQQACKKAVDLGNSGAAGHVCLGTIASGTGKYEEASAQFQHAAQLEGTNEYALVGLGGAYEHLGKRQDAEDTYKKMVQLRPNYYRGYNYLGIFYLRQAQYDDATRMFQKQIELTPESDSGYLNLGATFLYQGKYAEAIPPLERALAIRPSGLTYSNLGTTYFYQHRFRDSAVAYEKAVQLDDKDYITWGNLGEACYFDGEREKSVQAFQKGITLASQALGINPKDTEVLKHLAYYHAMTNDRVRAVAYLNDELNLSGLDGDALFGAAIIFNHLGETGTSLEWLRKALRAGFSPQQVLQEPGLDNLHDNPRFQELLKSSSSGPNPGK